ncbi:MAG: lipase maturation factor family protein [Polyangiaceae bacterium]|jgi:hypothetical protein
MSAVRTADNDPQSFRTAWWQRLAAERASYEITRFAVLRLLALVYLAAFVSLAWQGAALFGSHGLLPAGEFLAASRARLGSEAFLRLPTLFWWGASDAALALAWTCGIVLSVAVLAGVTNAGVQLVLWAIYGSFVAVGQIFYGYGWELQLLETGMLAVFLCPLCSVRPFPRRRTPKVTVWLLRWLIFRVMLGAGLIKLRGDSCWRDLTCLDFHFETQPNPNPLSFWFHHAPHAVHVAGVVFNHFVELAVPWFAFGFRRARHVAGAFLVALQFILILSGNLSFLNWLTIVPALACFDDVAFVHALPRSTRRGLLEGFMALPASRGQTVATGAFGVVVLVLSVGPVVNLLSSEQQMNASFDPLALVNTYGAFGSVDRTRTEVILEGTRDASPGPLSDWRPYELPCMPGAERRHPCWIAPYHDRLDWQMWFVGNDAARGEPIEDEPWLVHLVWQLLLGEEGPKSLLANDPFPGAPARWVRAGIWRYEFAPPFSGSAWWRRRRIGEYLPPVSIEHAGLRGYVRDRRWPDALPGG